jgi:phage-related protein
MKTYKLKWTAKGTMTVEAESKVAAIELGDMILYEDLSPTDADEFEVTEAESS